MYVIYINDRPLILKEEDEASLSTASAGNTHLIARYTGKKKSLLNYADMLEKGSPKVTSVEIMSDDVEALWEDFRAHYKWVEAAGGIVTNNTNGKQLFIYRRGYWDLPKGKLDDGESPAAAALREVRQETGVKDLTLGEALPTTFHTYRGKKNRILKPTFWFAMTTSQTELVPEDAEGIEQARWRTIDEVLRADEPIYASLRALLTAGKPA